MSSEAMTDPRSPNSSIHLCSVRAFPRLVRCSSPLIGPHPHRCIDVDVPHILNMLKSPLVTQVAQRLTAGGEDHLLDQRISSLRSNDPSYCFVSEIGAHVLPDERSRGRRRVYSETKAAEATLEVNSWTETVTNGHIKRVLPSMTLDISTKVVFKNALYLEGQWGEKFDASKTQEYDFHLPDGSSVKAPFMVIKEKRLVRVYDGFKVLALPFKQVQDKGPISLNIFLPDAKDGLQALEDRVVSQHESLKHHLPDQRVEVGDSRIPRFSSRSEASNALEGLGQVLPFSGEGGVSEMVPYGENLYVSSKFHKSSIEVNEEGMKAAAASVSVIKKREKIDFVADHPFLFLVRDDRTGLVLFSGRVVNPLVGC